jgi:hypothetical protein
MPNEKKINKEGVMMMSHVWEHMQLAMAQFVNQPVTS